MTFKPRRMYAVTFKEGNKSFALFEIYNTKKEAIQTARIYAGEFPFEDSTVKELRQRGYDIIPVIVRPA